MVEVVVKNGAAEGNIVINVDNLCKENNLWLNLLELKN